jgi:exonuclease SbcC
MVVGSKEPEKPDMAGAEKLVDEARVILEVAGAQKGEKKAAMDKACKVVNEHLVAKLSRQAQVKEIDRLDAQVKDLKAQAANVHAAENLARLEAEIVEKAKLQDAIKAYQAASEQAEQARAMVESCQAEAGFYDAMQKALAPAGIPTQMISEALAPVNELLAVAAGYLFPGRTLTLTPELDFALEGAPLLSKSAELRVGVAIQYVLAKLAGARLLMVDEVDMLDPANRKGFITFLRAVRPDFDTIMAFSTAASATPAPFDDVQVWAVNNGGVTAL